MLVKTSSKTRGVDYLFVMQLEGGTSINEQLCKRITELISNGTFAENEKLPAIREVAKSLGINPNTVQKAYAQLEQRGLIYSIPAKGSYVSERSNTSEIIKKQAVTEVEKALRNAINAGVEREELLQLIEKIEKEKGEQS